MDSENYRRGFNPLLLYGQFDFMVLSPSWMFREVRLTFFLCVCRNWVVDHLSITLFEHAAHVVCGTAGVDATLGLRLHLYRSLSGGIPVA